MERTYQKPDAKTLKKWSDMTEWNYHSELLVDVAEWFAKETEDFVFKSLVGAFKYVLDVHNKKGHMPNDLMTLRYCAMKELHRRIEELYRDDSAEILSCF